MKSKQRIINAIKGKETDKVPWCPFLAYFWESQPKSIRKMGQFKFMQHIGADPLLRGMGQLYEINRKGTEITENIKGNIKHTCLKTKMGTLHLEHTYVSKADTWYLTKHPINSKEDYKVLSWINENTTVTSNKEDFMRSYNDIGEDGLMLPIIGSEMKSCFQSLVEHWVGTTKLIYDIFDFPEVVESCLESMKNVAKKTVEISADSCAEGFIFWEDSSTGNYSPDMFEKYIAPEIKSWADTVHLNDKFLVHHACGLLKDILTPMANTGIDVIESISPPPTGNIEVWDARKKLPEKLALIGGIEPVFFQDCTHDELCIYVNNLLDKMENTSFVLANSDSCPPNVTVEKLKLVCDIVLNRK